jgi:hypothetical protein
VSEKRADQASGAFFILATTLQRPTMLMMYPDIYPYAAVPRLLHSEKGKGHGIRYMRTALW